MAIEITAEDIKAIIDDDILEKAFDKKGNIKGKSDDYDNPVYVQFSNKNNVVSGKKLREVQKKTLAETAAFLAKTFGPMGSNTKMVGGKDAATIKSEYSKDGLKVLKHIMNSGPIEASIVEELIDITRHVEKEVGDGTTSTVILSSKIFNRLTKIEEKYHMPPFKLIKAFKTVVSDIEDHIRENGRDCTTQDMYDIAMISTNGNETVAQNIKDMYDKYGLNVEINVGVSNTPDDQKAVYDGLIVGEGMSDAMFINNRENNTSTIRNARIYHFTDPIDDPNMIGLFEAILKHNIYDPMDYVSEHEEDDEDYDKELATPIPTVITCPKVSRDLAASLKRLGTRLYQFDEAGAEAAKPPVLIITNVCASDEIIMNDIALLCGCKDIHKYINNEIYNHDVEVGDAPTLENVWTFGGEADSVVADIKKTKFINPKHMTVGAESSDAIYKSQLNFLETELENQKAEGTANDIGLLKKRLSALKGNMVDYLVGGITDAERQSYKDLVEDAVKNCKSASLYGVGYAANFEGLIGSFKAIKDFADDPLLEDIAKAIFCAYEATTRILYGSVEYDTDKVSNSIINSMKQGYPFNISNGTLEKDSNGKSVMCSIMLDINILDTISKIISLMVTCNQCLLQGSNLNIY